MPPEEITYRQSVQDKLDAIIRQTTKTNGRVTSLESEAVKSAVWRARLTGAVIVLSFMVASVVIPLVAAWVQYRGI